MENFRLIQQNIDTQPFLDEIAAADNAWEQATGRQEKIRVQREALAIPIRGLRKSAVGSRSRRDVLESRWTSGSMAFPHTRRFIEESAERIGGLPGRAKIVNLPPGHRVYPHIDRGNYYLVHARFHLVLRSTEGSLLTTGGETRRLKPGELWWFDNNKVHEATNEGNNNRVHLIFDILPAASLCSIAT